MQQVIQTGTKRLAVQVQTVDISRFLFSVVVPGLYPGTVFQLSLRTIPSDVAAMIVQGHRRLTADINTLANSAQDVQFFDWQIG